MVMGTVMVQTHPNAQDVVALIAAAVHGHHTADGTFVGGLPRTLKWDNGGEFINADVTAACARLLISPYPSSPYAPFQKGKIERWHQTIQNELFSNQPGASDGPRTFSGREPWRGADDRLLTFTALTMLVQEWVTVYNTERRHSSLDKTPLQAWNDQAATNPLRMATTEQLHPLMLRAARLRTVNKDGISFGAVKYTAPGLAPYRRRKVSVRVLPHLVDRIFVFDGEKFICEAVRAENLTPDQRRELVRQRHHDWQAIKAAQLTATRDRARTAVLAAQHDPAGPVHTRGPDLQPAAGLRDDDALLALLGGDQ